MAHPTGRYGMAHLGNVIASWKLDATRCCMALTHGVCLYPEVGQRGSWSAGLSKSRRLMTSPPHWNDIARSPLGGAETRRARYRTMMRNHVNRARLSDAAGIEPCQAPLDNRGCVAHPQ